jgi:SAM-dependent methyltransferase
MRQAVPRVANAAGPVSPYLLRGLARFAALADGLALDVPCGGGRHTIHLAQQGYEVVGFDNDPQQIAKLELALGSSPGLRVRTLLGDATRPLPLPEGAFDLVVTTHFVSPDLLGDVARVLKSGGLFVYETFAGHGENWRSLPKGGAVAQELGAHFEMLDYRERPSGPAEAGTVVVQLIARCI